MSEDLKKEIRELEAQNRKLASRLDTATERIRGLEDHNFLLKTQMESSPDGILVVDTDRKLKSCNRMFLEIWGIPAEEAGTGTGYEIMERVLEKLVHPDAFLDRIHCFHESTDGRTRDELDLKDGRIIERYSRPLTDREGTTVGRICFFRDITQRKLMDLQAESALRKSEEMYRHVFEYHPLPLLIFDPQTLEILKVNDAAVWHYGYGREEFESLSVMDIRPPEDTDQFLKIIQSAPAVQDRPGIFRHRKKDGTVFLVDIHSHEITFDERPARLVLCRDVTGQILAREALEESEEKFRTAFITSPDSINLNRLEDGLYVDINEGFEKVMGYSREDVIGKTSLELDIWVNPEDRATLVKGLMESGQVNNLEALFRARDGTIRNGLMSARVIFLGGESFILSITRDMTEKKLAEERIRSSLHEKEILLREIHHRVKNNLQVVSGLINLQASFIEDQAIRERFRESENRVKAIAIMHEDLYQSQDLVSIDFAAHVRKLVENLLSSYRDSSCHVDLDMDLANTRLILDTAIPCSLVITELVSNALNHAFRGRKNGMLQVRFHPGESGTFSLQISDNGRGFPQDFDLGQVKSMGLQLVKLLVEQLGGTIEMTRENGTAFHITFTEYQEAGTEMY